jgi:hypothetical protein
MSEATALSSAPDGRWALTDDGPARPGPAGVPPGERDGDRPGAEDAEPRAHLHLVKLRRLWVISLGFVALQTALLIAWSSFQAHRFALGIDFSIYNQGAWLIAHGHLAPWSTIDGFSFARDHFTLLMWPISLIYALAPHPTTLLFLQDLASAGAGLVAIRWILEILEYRLRTTRGALGVGVVALIVGTALIAIIVDPWVWQADSFDFHMEAFSALLIVLATRDFWRHRPQRALVWCGLTLLSGDLGGLLVVGLGLSVIVAATGFRRWGVVALALGAAWTAVVHGLGFAHGSGLAAYAALVYVPPKTGPVTMFDLVRALTLHPARVYWAVKAKSGLYYQNLVPTGFLGLVNPWTFGVTNIVFLSAVLIGPAIYLQSGFQCIPAYALGLVGTVLTVVAILTHGDPRRRRRLRRTVAAVIGVVVLAQVAGLAAVLLPRTSSNWVRISSAQADALGSVLAATPQDAQVISSDGVLGRFSDREQVEPIPWWGGTAYPIRSREVVFVVVPVAGIESIPPASELKALAYVRDVLHARPIHTGNGVYAFRWFPGPDVHSLKIPT